MAVANDQTMALFIELITMLPQVVGHFLFNGLLERLLSPVAKGCRKQAQTDLAGLKSMGSNVCLVAGVFVWEPFIRF